MVLPRKYTFAQNSVTGTHPMWLYYWLASDAGVAPLEDAKAFTSAPPQPGRTLVRCLRGARTRHRIEPT
jgi:hypothetical protein